MKKNLWPIVLLLLVPVLVFAQGGTGWGEELTIQLFGLTLLGSVVIAAIVEKLKTWLKTTGWVNTAMALGVGVALGAIVWLLDLAFGGTVMPIWGRLIQGFFSGGIAAGLWKAARTLGRKG